MYKIVFDEAIKKGLKKLDKQTLKILFNWIEKNLSNTDDPRSKGKALVGNKKGYYSKYCNNLFCFLFFVFILVFFCRGSEYFVGFVAATTYALL